MNINIAQQIRIYVLLCVAVMVATSSASAEPERKANIILIMADDLGYGSLGCYGSKEIRTPNIDRLASSGIQFTDFHSNGPLCTPTRAALMTGRYPQRCVWVDDAELSQVFREQRKENIKQRWAWGISPDELTIADVLKKAGYRTALIGKWHLGYDSKFHPTNYGFDEFRGYVGGAVDYHTHVATHGLQELDWWKGQKIENQEGYSTDLLTQYAVDFIDRHKDVPFFLCLTHESPHDPWQGRNPEEVKPALDTYKEMIEVLDESVGAIVDAIRNHGLENNTLIIFCSDNGAAPPPGISANSPWRGAKGSMFEGGHRVPCIASWPGTIAPGSMSHDTVMTMDFFPTFAVIAGAVIPEDHQIDGVDIFGILKGQESIKPRVLYWLLGDSWAVRKGYWKLIGKGDNVTMLVNLDDDPAEAVSLQRQFPERVNELLSLYQSWVEIVGSR